MESYRSLRSKVVTSREHAAGKPLARAPYRDSSPEPLLLRLVSPSSLFNQHEILFRNPHGHSRHTTDYLGLIGMAERPCLLTGMGMRNQGQHAILNFAPPAGVARSNIQKVDGPCKLRVSRFLLNWALLHARLFRIDLDESTWRQQWPHGPIRRANVPE